MNTVFSFDYLASLAETLVFRSLTGGGTLSLTSGQFVNFTTPSYIVSLGVKYPGLVVAKQSRRGLTQQVYDWLGCYNAELYRRPDLYVGVWFDTSSQMAYFDISKMVSSPKNALEMATREKQLSYWDTANNRAIAVQADNEPDAAFKRRSDWYAGNPHQFSISTALYHFETFIKNRASRYLNMGYSYSLADTLNVTAETRPEELFHPLSPKHMLIWNGASDNTIFTSPSVNLMYRFIHDMAHFEHNLGFTAQNEKDLWEIVKRTDLTCVSAIKSGAALLYESEHVGQVLYFEQHGHFPANQVKFTLEYLKSTHYQPIDLPQHWVSIEGSK